uniref:Uncharacterized protein n=1 Tax=Anguilla anguilla TaxID=7936 RepID=A0A0E9SS92_ANGAN
MVFCVCLSHWMTCKDVANTILVDLTHTLVYLAYP